MLRLDDLPIGYKTSPPDNSSDDNVPAGVLTKFAACVKVPKAAAASLLDNTSTASQPNVEADFETDAGSLKETDIDSNVELDRSSKDISAPVVLFSAKSALGCWKQLFQTEFVHDPTSGPKSRFGAVVPLSMGSIHDEALALQVRFSVSTPKRTVPVDLDLYFVGRGRAGISLSGTWIGGHPDTGLEQSLVEAIFGRLKAASDSRSATGGRGDARGSRSANRARRSAMSSALRGR